MQASLCCVLFIFVVVVQMISLFGGNSSKSLYPLISEKRMSFLDRNLFSVLIQDLVFGLFLGFFFGFFSFCKSGSTVVSIIYLPVGEREGPLF